MNKDTPSYRMNKTKKNYDPPCFFLSEVRHTDEMRRDKVTGAGEPFPGTYMLLFTTQNSVLG